MTSYISKLQKVEGAIIRECSDKITDEFNTNYFDMWLSIDAPSILPSIYEKEFLNEFGDLVDEDASLYTQTCGSNLYYHLDTVTSIQRNLTLDELLEYVETFIKAQIDDFSNMCDNIQTAMSENIEAAIEETNPSNT